MILSIGEILFDVFPGYRRLGGAPYNVAFHMKHMGHTTRFVSRVGDDAFGREILDKLTSHGFRVTDIQIDPEHETGQVDVTLDSTGSPEFNIRKPSAWDHIDFSPAVEALAAAPPALFYFGSLVQRTRTGTDLVHRVLSRLPGGTLRFYDMNLRPGCRKAGIIRPSLGQADVLKLNQDELEEAGRMLGYTIDGDDLVRALMTDFRLKAVAVTLGGDGSTLFIGGRKISHRPSGDVAIADTVGAGDAYAAVLAAGLVSGDDPDRIIERASAFSAAVCGIKGALPDDESLYEDLRVSPGKDVL